MNPIEAILRAISTKQPPGKRTIDRHNSYDNTYGDRAPDTRSVASDNRGGRHPWRAPIPTGKRAGK